MGGCPGRDLGPGLGNFCGASVSSAKVGCDLEQLPAHLSRMYRELVVTFFICQETRYPKYHRSFCFIFIFLLAVPHLLLYTPPL